MVLVGIEEQDQLDQMGVACESIEDGAIAEDNLWNHAAKKSSTPCPPKVREIAAQVFRHLLQCKSALDTPPELRANTQQNAASQTMAGWFAAMTIFDVYFQRGTPQIQDLPTTVFSIVNLVSKIDNSDPNSTMCHGPLGAEVKRCTQWVADYLTNQGYADVDASISEEGIFVAEKNILKALGFQLNVPNVESWLYLYYLRLAIVAPKQCKPWLAWAWQYAMQVASYIVVQQAPSSYMPPRRLARGLLAAALRRCRLLSPSALASHGVKGANLAGFYPNGEEGDLNDLDDGEAMPIGQRQPAAADDSLLEHLQFAMDENLEVIAQDLQAVIVLGVNAKVGQQAPRNGTYHV
mmetsp:Transcript_10486/g.23825  ORF Transcript_10486/g.23825 Transcript_10486/m.23825 type:complete len:350 (-) Transcript_10486:98-1147(-)|eukprot:CAMPEP_0178428764 /NCGR_PEP_ID=MMETSP0689_2-20121128/30451_1 /TAXON_ID=160604 /ORGANISM="Amphidinium massartii, Strain CS-259" /LENGTH=349 /DNA_ID=CAMNT_0020050557 /DNA_START=75 /DNA_END=1124 /DNA_ORIENTATION=-